MKLYNPASTQQGTAPLVTRICEFRFKFLYFVICIDSKKQHNSVMVVKIGSLQGMLNSKCLPLSKNLNFIEVMKTRPTFYPIWYGWKEMHVKMKYRTCASHVEMKYRTCASLCYLYNIDIFQYVTQNSTCTRQNTLYFSILKLILMYTLVWEVHVFIKVIWIEQFSSKPVQLSW